MKRTAGFTFLQLGMLLAILVGGLSAQVNLRTEFQDTQPKFIAQADGSYAGLCLEIMHLIEKNSDFRFSYPATFVPISRITQDLETGQIDAYFGLVKSPQREKAFNFLGELFATRYQILARRDDPLAGITSLAQLQAAKVPIMVIKGSGSALYFQGLPALSYTDAPTAVETALQQLKAGRARLFGYYDLGNDWFMDNYQYREDLVALKIEFDLDTQWLCVSRKLPAVWSAKLATTLETIKKSSEWRAIMKTYFPGR